MNMKTILEYQEKDRALRAAELSLKGSDERKRVKLAQAFLAKADETAQRLDKRAADITAQFNEVSAMYRGKLKEIQEFKGVAEGLEEHKEIEYIERKLEKAIADVKRLEAETAELAREIEATVNEFADLRKKVKAAREEYADNRAKYEKMQQEKAPEIEKLKAELEKAEKGVDADLLAKYKKKRGEKIFPVFVKANGEMCGGCRMEIPLAARNRLNTEKLIECEECKRFIYVEG